MALTKDQAEGLLNHYRYLIDMLQGRVFYAEDADGALRRWYPPMRPMNDKPLNKPPEEE